MLGRGGLGGIARFSFCWRPEAPGFEGVTRWLLLAAASLPRSVVAWEALLLSVAELLAALANDLTLPSELRFELAAELAELVTLRPLLPALLRPLLGLRAFGEGLRFAADSGSLFEESGRRVPDRFGGGSVGGGELNAAMGV